TSYGIVGLRRGNWHAGCFFIPSSTGPTSSRPAAIERFLLPLSPRPLPPAASAHSSQTPAVLPTAGVHFLRQARGRVFEPPGWANPTPGARRRAPGLGWPSSLGPR